MCEVESKSTLSTFDLKVAISYRLYCNALEEGIAEGTIAGGGPLQVPDAFFPGRFIDQPEPDRLFLHSFNHSGERISCEALDELRSRRIDIDGPRGDIDLLETGIVEEMV